MKDFGYLLSPPSHIHTQTQDLRERAEQAEACAKDAARQLEAEQRQHLEFAERVRGSRLLERGALQRRCDEAEVRHQERERHLRSRARSKLARATEELQHAALRIREQQAVLQAARASAAAAADCALTPRLL